MRPIFGVTDSPREVERKRKAAERAARRARPDVWPRWDWGIERHRDGTPVRLWLVPARPDTKEG
jgi:hypothetical protein